MSTQMGRLSNHVETVDNDVAKIDKEDILDTSFCFQKAYFRETDDGKYWKVYGFFPTLEYDETHTHDHLFFIVPSSESRDKLMEAMNAVAPLHFCSLTKQTYTPQGGKIEQTFYAFVALENGLCACGDTGCNGHHFNDFLADYKGITKEEIEARAEYVKVDKKDILDKCICIEKLILKSARDETSRPYWCVYVQADETSVTREDGSTTNKVMFFLPSSPSRDTLFKSLLNDDMPIHCSKVVEKSFTPKGQKEARTFYALEDTKSDFCTCGCDLGNDKPF